MDSLATFMFAIAKCTMPGLTRTCQETLYACPCNLCRHQACVCKPLLCFRMVPSKPGVYLSSNVLGGMVAASMLGMYVSEACSIPKSIMVLSSKSIATIELICHWLKARLSWATLYAILGQTSRDFVRLALWSMFDPFGLCLRKVVRGHLGSHLEFVASRRF